MNERLPVVWTELGMLNPIRVLIVEDSAEDAELLLNDLVNYGLAPTWERVETEADYFADGATCD